MLNLRKANRTFYTRNGLNNRDFLLALVWCVFTGAWYYKASKIQIDTGYARDTHDIIDVGEQPKHIILVFDILPCGIDIGIVEGALISCRIHKLL